jgi:hypothetical protein
MREGTRMWIVSWEFLVVGAMWGLALILFKTATPESSGRAAKLGVGALLILSGVALLVLRFGFHYGK